MSVEKGAKLTEAIDQLYEELGDLKKLVIPKPPSREELELAFTQLKEDLKQCVSIFNTSTKK